MLPLSHSTPYGVEQLGIYRFSYQYTIPNGIIGYLNNKILSLQKIVSFSFTSVDACFYPDEAKDASPSGLAYFVTCYGEQRRGMFTDCLHNNQFSFLFSYDNYFLFLPNLNRFSALSNCLVYHICNQHNRILLNARWDNFPHHSKSCV